MSLPKYPRVDPPLTRDEAINQIIASIAMEEVALSHIINAEGEKLQYILGTLHDDETPPEVTIEQILEVNESVKSVLQSAAESQSVLRAKLQAALSSAVMYGPQGPEGPAGPKSEVEGVGLCSELRSDTGSTYASGDPILFNSTRRIGSTISQNSGTGVITITDTGLYTISWWAFMDGSSVVPYELAIEVNGTDYAIVGGSDLDIQLHGSTLLYVNGSATVRLKNSGDSTFAFKSGLPVQAQIMVSSYRTLPVIE